MSNNVKPLLYQIVAFDTKIYKALGSSCNPSFQYTTTQVTNIMLVEYSGLEINRTMAQCMHIHCVNEQWMQPV